MQLIVNGVREQCDSATVAALVDLKGLAQDALVVELNGVIVRQDQWPQTPLQDGDRLELLTFVGGG